MHRFKAKLLAEGPEGAWTFLRVPADVSSAFGKKGRVSVAGTINGFAFRSSIFPDGKGGHHMMINKAMREGAGAAQGQTVEMTLDLDKSPREVAVPKDLAAAMKGSAAASKFFKGLAPSCRREYVEWIESAKRDSTRKARIDKSLTMLMEGRRRVRD